MLFSKGKTETKTPTRRDTLALICARPCVTHADEMRKFNAYQELVELNRNPEQDRVLAENNARFANWR